jgi:hypothetical protein
LLKALENRYQLLGVSWSGRVQTESSSSFDQIYYFPVPDREQQRNIGPALTWSLGINMVPLEIHGICMDLPDYDPEAMDICRASADHNPGKLWRDIRLKVVCDRAWHMSTLVMDVRILQSITRHEEVTIASGRHAT